MSNRYPFELKPLPYEYNALEPHIDEATMKLHHDKHLKAYVDKLNEISKGDYSTVTLFITDIIKNGSYVLYNDQSKHIVEDSFDLENLEQGTFIPNLVSRKKQMLPKIMESLERNN